MSMLRFKARLVAIILLSPLLASAQTFSQQSQHKRPVAVGKMIGGDLFVLDASGRVLRLKVTAQGLASAGAFSLSPPLSPTDLVSAVPFGQPVVLVTTDNQKSGFLTQYSLEGRVEKTWIFPRLVLGLDVDRNANIAYVTAYDLPVVFRIRLQQPEAQSHQSLEPEFVGEILGARGLGPVTVDLSRGRLYLGDIEAGKIFQLDLKTNRSKVIATKLASPQALLMSSDGNRLYIADASQRKVYVLDLQTPGSAPRVFSSLHQFRSPTGLAALEDGRIVVADEQAGALFVLTQQGTMQSVFPL